MAFNLTQQQRDLGIVRRNWYNPVHDPYQNCSKRIPLKLHDWTEARNQQGAQVGWGCRDCGELVRWEVKA